MSVSACGLICKDCNFHNNPCKGCYQVKGETFWAKDHTKNGICPLYNCSINKKKLNHCGECSKLPCHIFNDLKDPNISKEEHIESINQRVEKLKNLN